MLYMRCDGWVSNLQVGELVLRKSVLSFERICEVGKFGLGGGGAIIKVHKKSINVLSLNCAYFHQSE